MATENDRKLCQLALRRAFLDRTQAEWYLRSYAKVGQGEGSARCHR